MDTILPHSLTLLGTGTCQIQQHRMASSVLLNLGETSIVFDCGRGVTQRLHQVGLKNDDVQHIVLSHFHPDHISDLIPFLQAACWSRIDPRSRNLHVYGPKGVKVQMMRLISLFGPDELTREHFEILVDERRDGVLRVDTLQFDFLPLPPAGNHGLRFTYRGKRIAITGDSDFHQQEIDFLQGVDLAVIDSGHISDEQIVTLASRTQVAQLVCSHLYRELDAEKLQSKAQALGYKGEIIVGKDLMQFPL